MPATVRTPRSSDGTSIHAEAVGDPRNPHVVFIHEATLSSSVFDELFEDPRLTEHLYLVRYDLRCHGQSGTAAGAGGHSSALYAADFSAVAGAFALHKPILVAWGFGAAAVADICAHIRPLPVAGVAFIAPLPFLGALLPPTTTTRMRGIIQSLEGAGAAHDAAAAGRAKTELMNAIVAGTRRRIPDALRARWLGRCVVQDAEVSAAVLARENDPTALLEAGRAGLPMLLLVGAEDAVVEGGVVARELLRHFRNMETHVVGGSGHALFVDCREEFVKLLFMFVGKLSVLTLMS